MIKQLHINQVFDANNDGYDGYQNFDGYVALHPDFIVDIHRDKKRILVMRSMADFNNRELADVVIFMKHGMASILKNKIGVPTGTFPLLNLYWRQLGVYD